MQFVSPNKDDPALVMFVIEKSTSMEKSGVIKLIYHCVIDLQKRAAAKPGTVRFKMLTFGTGVDLVNDGPLESTSPSYEKINFVGHTHLKLAVSKTLECVAAHVETHCSKSNPLVNILFFTEGKYNYFLDKDENPSGYTHNKWFGITPDSIISPLVESDNVLVGLIDFDKNNTKLIKSFPDKSYDGGSFRLGKCSILEESVVEEAYARNRANPSNKKGSLDEVFGDLVNLVNNRFVVCSKEIEKSPRVITAFVRLGTYGSIPDIDDDKNIEGNINFDEVDF